MRTTAPAAVWALILVGFLGLTPAAFNAGSADFTPFELDEQGGIVVPAMLNGAGPFRLLLDTGSTHSSISEELVGVIGAPLVAKRMVTSAIGERMHLVAHLERITLGPITAVTLRPSLIRADSIDPTGRIQGIIGQDVLAPCHYTIDYRERRVIWERDAGPSRGSALMLTPDEGRFVVALPHGESVLRLVPDSGASTLLLFHRGNRRLPAMSVVSTSVELTTLSARKSVQYVIVSELRVGFTRLRDLPAVLVERTSTEEAQTDGLLPLHLFNRVTFDGPRGLLSCSRGGPPCPE